MLQKSMRKLLSLSEKYSKYLIAAVIVFVVLLPKFPMIKVPGTYVSIRFEDVLMLLLGISLIPKFILDFKSIFKDKVAASILIFFGVALLSVLTGYLVSDTVDLKIGILHWARRIEYIIPFLAIYLLTPREKIKENLIFYFKVLVIVVVISFFYGLGQRYLKLPVIITQNEEYSKGIALRWTPGAHINSTFAGHYDLSAFMVLTLPIFIGGIFLIKDKLVKIALALTSGMGLWLLINSISRTAQATYLFAVTVALFLSKKFKGWILVAFISVVFMFLSSGLDARFTRAIKVLYEHFTTGESFSYVPKFRIMAEDELPVKTQTPTSVPVAEKIKDVSISIRYNVEWPRAIRAFIKNPILGTGYSSIGLATDNDYLRMLGETGILGLASFVLIFLHIGKKFFQVFLIREKLDGFEKTFLFGMIGGVLGILATAVLIDLFEASKLAIMLWLLLGCSVSLVNYKLNEK